ncbi:MAG: aminodeoxychorismate synthase component I [Hyphomonadaceae bacterium]|nr:aminodeoxychorismate synthase component I [Hyphomonadaceae bacterium]MBC6412282.1 aminodeoxychorismate synthase component I [Hyphomonadaceae bacterium]
MSPEPYILLDDQVNGTVRHYTEPVEIIRVNNPDDIQDAFGRLEAHQRQGYYLAGYIAYETGLWLEPKLRPLLACHKQILLEFGVFENAKNNPSPEIFDTRVSDPRIRLCPCWSAADYMARFEQVQAYIRAGDVYQINLTFPMKGYYTGTARAVYDGLRCRQPGAFGAIVSLSDHQIVSFSPELFFKTNGPLINTRPMKGTARRLLNPNADKAQANALKSDAKNRAENLMIVDLLRNDLSRIARTGSVSVPKLFALETYPTLHQMTSHIQANLRDDIKIMDLFKALFPCGSVTGAPKIRAMEIIHELEGKPRGAYCGAVGYIDPGGDSCFSVAIRTLTLRDNMVAYNIGGGIVSDSDGADEYVECLLKSEIISPPHTIRRPSLIETFRWTADKGVIRRERHLARLSRSAKALDYPLDVDEIIAKLKTLEGETDLHVRLDLSPDGSVCLQATQFKPLAEPLKLSVSRHSLSRDIQEINYKVSHRDFYDGERSRVAILNGCDELVFFNARGELCEGSFTSLFIERDGRLLTPSLSCGLLPGILREELVSTGKAAETVLRPDDLGTANAVYVGNSLRGLMRADLISLTPV